MKLSFPLLLSNWLSCTCKFALEKNINVDFNKREWWLKFGPIEYVDWVLSFFSSHPKWDSPTPLPAGERAPPPLWFRGGGTHTLAGGRGGGSVPIPTRGQTLWNSRYICTLWFNTFLQRRYILLIAWLVVFVCCIVMTIFYTLSWGEYFIT
jgi:hypothetical protein